MIETSAETRKSTQFTKPNPGRFLSLNILWLLLTLIPVVLLALTLANYTLQVPYLDELFFAPLVAKLHTGGFTLADFWNQHNEHRIALWRILALALAKLGGYSVPKETWAGFGFAVLSLVVAWRLISLSVPGRWVGPIVAGWVWLLFSTSQWEDWMWGFQFGWFLVIFDIALVVLILSYRPLKPIVLVSAIGLTFLASFTNGTALPAWVAILIGMGLNRREWPWRYILTWALSGSAALGLYFYHYNATPLTPELSKTYFLQKIPETILFFLKCLGAAVANWDIQFEGTLWAGLLLLVVGSASSGWLAWQARGEPAKSEAWLKAWPWFVLFMFGLLNAGLSAISRVGLGVDSALASRYTTDGVWTWLAGLTLGGLAGREWFKKFASPGRKKILVAALTLAGLIGVISFGFTYANGLRTWQFASNYYNAALPFFYEYETAPTDPLGRVFVYDMPRIRNTAWLLSQYHEGPFRVTKEQYQQAQSDKWQQELKNNHYQPNVYPGNLMVMTQGDGASVRVKGDHLTFQHLGATETTVQFDLSKFYQQAGLANQLESIPIEIQLETAHYVTIFYDIGHDFNYNQQVALTTALEPAGQRIFRLKLPPGTQRFRVSAAYRVSRLQQDSLKVIVYTTSH